MNITQTHCQGDVAPQGLIPRGILGRARVQYLTALLEIYNCLCMADFKTQIGEVKIKQKGQVKVSAECLTFERKRKSPQVKKKTQVDSFTK